MDAIVRARKGRAWAVKGCVVAALVTGGGGVVGCGGGGDASGETQRTGMTSADPPPQTRQLTAQETATGERLFAEHCASCHGLAGRPQGETTGEHGPNFDGVRPSEAYVRYRIEYGGYGMQTFKYELTPAQADLLAAYVAAVSGRDVPNATAASLSDEQLQAGRRVFVEACQSCHAIGAIGRIGSPTFPGTNFNNVKVGPRRAHRMLSGDYWMPSVRDELTRREMRDVVRYVVALSRSDSETYLEP